MRRNTRTVSARLVFAAASAFCVVAAGAVEPPKVFPVPWWPRSESAMAEAKERVEYLKSLSQAEMLAIVPAQSGIYFTACPACAAGTADSGDWEWTPRSPTRIRCKGCGEVYPDNPRFPDDRFIEVRAPEGVHCYPYFETAEGYRIFLRARADYYAADYMAKGARDLGHAYWRTQDEDSARRAALILLRFAEVYPTWAYKYDYPFRQSNCSATSGTAEARAWGKRPGGQQIVWFGLRWVSASDQR